MPWRRKADRDDLFELALEKLAGRKPGWGEPLLWHLAMRGNVSAMLELGIFLDNDGPISDSYSSEGLAYRAYRLGNSLGAENLARICFDANDLKGYRHWLRKASQLGEIFYELDELKRFETRSPHPTARKIGRWRPVRRSERADWEYMKKKLPRLTAAAVG